MVDMIVACSPGGHFSEARKIVEGLNNVTYKFVTHDLKQDSVDSNTIIAPHVNRDWRLITQIIFAYRLIRKEKPIIILSTGSSIAVSFFLVAKFMGIKTVYVESPTRVITPSLTAKIVRFLGSRMYVRYPQLRDKLPNSIYVRNE